MPFRYFESVAENWHPNDPAKTLVRLYRILSCHPQDYNSKDEHDKNWICGWVRVGCLVPLGGAREALRERTGSSASWPPEMNLAQYTALNLIDRTKLAETVSPAPRHVVLLSLVNPGANVAWYYPISTSFLCDPIAPGSHRHCSLGLSCFLNIPGEHTWMERKPSKGLPRRFNSVDSRWPRC